MLLAFSGLPSEIDFGGSQACAPRFYGPMTALLGTEIDYTFAKFGQFGGVGACQRLAGVCRLQKLFRFRRRSAE
jgi:hypothetical protein